MDFFRCMLLLALSVPFASAHLENGVDVESGPYIADIGWEPGAPAAGEPVFFGLNIVDKETGQPPDLSSAWVRLSRGEEIAFAGTFALDNGSTSFTYEFPEAGEWEMDVRLGNRSVSIPLEVAPGQAPPDPAWAFAAAFALLSAALAWRLSRGGAAKK